MLTSLIQAVFGVIVLSWSLVAQIHYQPYRSMPNNWMELFLLVLAVCFVLLCLLEFYSFFARREGEGMDIV
jgi:uncharacterized membrane protein